MDRRVLKTKKAIITAFLDLIKEKGFEKITINDIARCADINRGTVYLHFIDKYDLLDKCIDSYIDDLLLYCKSDTTKQPDASALYHAFKYMEGNYENYQILFIKESANHFRMRLYAVIEETVSGMIPEELSNKSFSKQITTHFLTSAIIGILEWWLGNAMPCSIDELTGQLWNLLQPYSDVLRITEV